MDTVQWFAVLNSCSAAQPYRRQFHGEIAPWTIAEFLIKAASFPRSIRFCVGSLDHSLHNITGVEGRDFHYKVEAERLSGKLLADLSYVTIDDVFQTGLHQYLDGIQFRLGEINQAIYEEFCEWLD